MAAWGRLIGLSCLVAGVAGCSAPPEQGRVPTTAEHCRADYDAAQQRIGDARRSASYSGGSNALANSIGTAIGVGISKGIYERRYQECLVAIGGAPASLGGAAVVVERAPVAVAPQKGQDGRYPLPTQYALMPGDVAIWPQLTAAQQERAILFLKDGSTIRSSLQGDE